MLECASTDTQELADAVEDLATALNHHVDEEEQTILDPARTRVTQQVRDDLGLKFLALRGKHLDDNAGDVQDVRCIVAAARQDGLLDD